MSDMVIPKKGMEIKGFTPTDDNVNHPEHYTYGGMECIDAMIETQGTYTVACFCLCNAFKYLWRHNHKDNSMEDVLKAQWYLNKYVDLMTVGEVRDGR